jgi:hypothetical protein
MYSVPLIFIGFFSAGIFTATLKKSVVFCRMRKRTSSKNYSLSV